MGMAMINQEAPRRPDIEALLPWHAAGTLSRRDAERVERALAADRQLARQFDMVREELGETIHLNESLGVPTSRALERLMAAIDAGAPVAPRRRSFNPGGRVAERLTRLRPRTLAWAAIAAALAIVLQAMLIAGLVMRASEVSRGFQSALSSDDASSGAGTFVLVSFVPQASAGDITAFCAGHKAKVVDGPSADGYYKIRISPAKLPREEVAAIVRSMQEDSRVVRFAASTN
jgi:anti-sigma-K factor RskA